MIRQIWIMRSFTIRHQPADMGTESKSQLLGKDTNNQDSSRQARIQGDYFCSSRNIVRERIFRNLVSETQSETIPYRLGHHSRQRICVVWSTFDPWPLPSLPPSHQLAGSQSSQTQDSQGWSGSEQVVAVYQFNAGADNLCIISQKFVCCQWGQANPPGVIRSSVHVCWISRPVRSKHSLSW